MSLRTTAGELQDAASELGCLHRGEPDVVEAFEDLLAAQRAIRGQLAQVVNARADGAEHVVQIVRNARADTAERFESLALQELIFDWIEGREQQHDVRADLDLVAERQK